jgi:hypothetical protein
MYIIRVQASVSEADAVLQLYRKKTTSTKGKRPMTQEDVRQIIHRAESTMPLVEPPLSPSAPASSPHRSFSQSTRLLFCPSFRQEKIKEGSFLHSHAAHAKQEKRSRRGCERRKSQNVWYARGYEATAEGERHKSPAMKTSRRKVSPTIPIAPNPKTTPN